MKRKIKRKLFLMGMVVTAGLPGAAFAKGSGKLERVAEFYSGDWRSLSLSEPAAASGNPGVYGKLKTIVGRMNYSIEVPTASAKPGTWRLEMMQPDVPLDQADVVRPTGEKRLGLALRVAF